MINRIDEIENSGNGPAVFYCIGNSYTIKKRGCRTKQLVRSLFLVQKNTAGL